MIVVVVHCAISSYCAKGLFLHSSSCNMLLSPYLHPKYKNRESFFINQ
ncbi:hypothetical protein HMPREF9446_00187 [Bacteroides fluxus YIT 12057]|uniref:Uncharacterized protein n=1 Tax=Bacteroides fluxus YIT 12057 TaxID=763034 RepID=F3PNA2_9BACE|nr:hypothetical protein HMPREF9446_00187 [Bacteroides fluxus YIT 12057]